ncbi:transposase, partial [Ferrithrix thermotolerans]
MTRRQFDGEFKKDAVRLVESGNLSVRQVAEDLGISKATLSNWVDKARKERREAGAPQIWLQKSAGFARRTSSSEW